MEEILTTSRLSGKTQETKQFIQFCKEEYMYNAFQRKPKWK